MRQGASFDLVALDPTARSVLDDADAEAEPARRAQHDSRSTSSASSPAPPENEESDFFVAGNDSQSSLGVPNLQDMQVADDACLSPFNRLPNEILIAIFARLSSPADLLRIMKVCKRWARNAVEILWHRPSCTTWEKHERICRTLALEHPYFSYRDFVRRLNLSALAAKVNDGSVMPLAACTRVERLTLTGCSNLTDLGLIALVSNNSHLYSLDVSLGSSSSSSSEVVFHDHITEASIDAISANCPRLQGLNVSGCHRIANESFIQLAHSCRYIKRLNNCPQLSDDAVLAFAEHCPNILELDLNQCRQLTNEPVTALFTKARALREFRLAGCDLIDDAAFLSLPPGRRFEHLRILDLSSCTRLTDRAVEKITEAAPRLRNLVLQKCRNLTDASVYAISRLGKNLHYLHLGHCSLITDEAVKHLVSSCNRMRYIDLGCCTRLTDDSVTKLAALPKLKRIGLVKCASITDASVIALANANRRPRLRKDSFGNMIPGEYSSSQSCLERVHLSYCTNLTQESIIRLLNSCPRLTHLSLTGVQAFLRDDLEDFSRDAPPEFTEHQRSVFCVFSGQGVVGLRRHLNQLRQAQLPPRDGSHANETIFPDMPVATAGFSHLQTNEGGFDDPEADAIDEDDGLEDGSEMVIDPQPLLNNQNPAIPPLPPTQSMPQDSEPVSPTNPIPYVSGHPPYLPHRVVPPQPPTLQAPQPEASTSQESASANPNDPFANTPL
ncbi:uncharacterized protein THITE_2107996 [Thermothielavioides terrestris NRRL 8126]|uniref:F-box domain-containing protein n=1 Tax=Thermothielavioides terrestris (strain ATCC 38088 / NRRL 8126) TaxID=578455 RepID=G2QWV1_THETT|nr:uncharacterized protein THITE_2107996 [Thermothielavioides terrestris NRRL 8126]AEO63115.1 hypothetical protein THITE_2107996 [Thermothielavioides terrestris NRRL 8126]